MQRDNIAVVVHDMDDDNDDDNNTSNKTENYRAV